MRDPASYRQFVEAVQESGSGRELLDIGCGPGLLLSAAARAGYRVSGVDLSAQAVALARRLNPEARVAVAQAAALPFSDEVFDVVTCVGVLEHVPDRPRALREMIRVARPAALFCIMVPNSKTLFWRAASLLSSGYRESGESAAPLSEWRALFEREGMWIEEVRRDRWRLEKALSLIGIRGDALRTAAGRWIARVIPLRSAHQFIFLMRSSREKVGER